MALKLYNSLTKKLEEFKPLNPESVSMYVCGPTVYFFQHIGNFRTFTLGDILARTLKYNGYNVSFVMNITDVGHLTGDNVGDADTGVDKLEQAADKEGKSAKAIADFYTTQFMGDYEKLGLTKPFKFTRATEYIIQQIDLIQTLEQKGFTYLTPDGVYFDTSKLKNYGELSGQNLDELKEGARLEVNTAKINPTDFALWKFSPEDKMRWQEWDSPWGRGFPGWHLECSAMALTELGETLDIHIGGEEHKMIHHPNEIAQSESATGKQFVHYWMHGAHLLVDGHKMAKSDGETYTISDLEEKGFSPLALRYLYMTTHYRGKQNFTWEALQNAQNALNKLYSLVEGYKESGDQTPSSKHTKDFEAALNDDLNMPKALAVVWDLLKDNVPESSKIATLTKFDEVLGLDIEDHVGYVVPVEVEKLAKVRWEYKKNGIWDKADVIRKQIESEGFLVEDSPTSYKIKRKI